MFIECNAGPFKVNGVPLRRVNQAYVIATSTKIDISSVDVAKHSDSYFKKEVTKKKKGESEFFEAEKDVSISLTISFNCTESNDCEEFSCHIYPDQPFYEGL